MGGQNASRSQKFEDISSYFDKSASAVRGYADKFEQAYARPIINSSLVFFDEHPISSTFIAIFSLLSFLPVVLFIGFSFLAVASFTAVALTSVFIASVAAELFFISLLLLALLTNLFISVSLTLSTISVYLAVRFAILVHHNGRVGVSEWASETKGHILHAKAKVFRSSVDHESSDASTGSVIAVKGNGEAPKVEN